MSKALEKAVLERRAVIKRLKKLILMTVLYITVLGCSVQYGPKENSVFYEDLIREVVRSGEFREYYSSDVRGSPRDAENFDAVIGSIKSEMYHFYSPPKCGFFEFCLGFSYISEKKFIRKIELTFYYESEQWVIGSVKEYIGIKLDDVIKKESNKQSQATLESARLL